MIPDAAYNRKFKCILPQNDGEILNKIQKQQRESFFSTLGRGGCQKFKTTDLIDNVFNFFFPD